MTLLSPHHGADHASEIYPAAVKIFEGVIRRVRISNGRDTGPSALPHWSPIASYTAHLVSTLAPIFELPDGGVIERAAAAVICFDYFCRAIDRMTDENDSTIEGIHEATLVLLEGVGLATSLSHRSERLLAKIRSYFAEASAGERFLWRHKGDQCAFGDIDFKMMGQKNAVMKSAAAALASASGKWDLLERLEPVIHDLSVCIQLIDDLIDWENDLKAGYYSHVVNRALATASSTEVEQLREALIFRGVAAEIINLALEHFNRAFQALFRIGLSENLPGLSEAGQSLIAAQALLRSASGTPAEIELILQQVFHPVLNYGH